MQLLATDRPASQQSSRQGKAAGTVWRRSGTNAQLDEFGSNYSPHSVLQSTYRVQNAMHLSHAEDLTHLSIYSI